MLELACACACAELATLQCLATHRSSPEHLELRTKMHPFRRKGAIIAPRPLVDVDIVKMRKTPRIVFALPPPAAGRAELHFCNLDFTRFSLSSSSCPPAGDPAQQPASALNLSGNQGGRLLGQQPTIF